MVMKIHNHGENQIAVLRFSIEIWLYLYGEYFSPWKLKTAIKIHHCDENKAI